jgi:hypothetical protein
MPGPGCGTAERREAGKIVVVVEPIVWTREIVVVASAEGASPALAMRWASLWAWRWMKVSGSAWKRAMASIRRWASQADVGMGI